MHPVIASCAIGADPCDDAHLVTVSLVPWWGVVLIVVGVLALVAGSVGLLVRADRARPWD